MTPKPFFKRSLPNLLTLLRLILVPVTFLFIQYEWYLLAYVSFAIAGITDYVDGYLARYWKVQSRLGRLLDPLADKALMFTTYLSLGIKALIPWKLVFLVVGRDIMILGVGLWVLVSRLPIRLAPTISSKINTFTQLSLVGIVLLFSSPIVAPFSFPPLITILIYLTALTTVWSGVDYFLYLLGNIKRWTIKPPKS